MSRRRAQQQLCPTPSKLRYESFEAALEHYEAQLVDPVLAHLALASYAYPCPWCSWWHRSHKTGDGTRSLARRPITISGGE